jgi:hypothetical protein
MTEQHAASGVPPTGDDPTPPAAAGPDSLEQYFRENQGRITEDALAERARAAGHTDAAIAAALESTRALPPAAGGRAVRAIIVSYGIVFAVLSLAMLANSSQSRGEFMPDGRGGIFILAISLGVAGLASLVWVASRRAFWSILSVPAFVAGLSALGSSPIWGLALIGGSIGVLWLMWRSDWRDVGTRADIGVLLLVPMLLLLGVGGICLASGLPLPPTR